MLLPKAPRAAWGAEGAGSAAWGLMGTSPRGLDGGTHLGHQAQRGLVQSQHERPQILQSL